MTTAKKYHGPIIALTVIASIVFLMFFNLFDANAQYLSYWSEQKKIPAYEIYNNEQPPYLIADNNHKIYAFNSQFIGDVDTVDAPKAVFYREWTLASGWTYPNDILADIDGSIDLLGVSSDESGRVHLIYQKNQGIYYSQAFLANASNPENWSIPISIAENSLQVITGIANVAAISTDKTGEKIIVIYSGSQSGNGLYFTYSTDSGSTWSLPYPAYLTGDDTLIVTSPSLYLGQLGFIYAVWSTIDDKGFGGPGYYSKFDLNSGMWSEPIELDQPGIRTPSVIEYKGDVFVGYYHSSTNGRWWRRTSDGGKTWTNPIQLSPRHVGTNGGVSFVIDSNEILHAFFGGRTDADGNHGIWHSSWEGTTWTPPEAVVKGQGMGDIDGGENNFDPTYARAVISNGNVILVSWGTDGAAGTTEAWYSYKILDSPELPSKPLQVPPILFKNTLTPTNDLIATGIPTLVVGLPDDLKNQNDASINRTSTQIYTWIIILIIFLLIAFVFVGFYKKDR